MKRIIITISITSIIVISILLINEILNYRKYSSKLLQQIIITQNERDEYKKNLFTTLQFQNFTLDSLTNDYSILKDKFLIIFPENICNICYEKVFYNIAKLDQKTKNKIIAAIHPKFKRKFNVYNTTYNLNIKHIIPLNKLPHVPNEISNELVFLYITPQNKILIPIILNAQFCDISSYIKTIYKYKSPTYPSL